MLYLLYSATNRNSVNRNLGTPEYSYFFVHEYFRDMLNRFGQQCVVITDPEQEADRYWQDALTRGESCVLLSFAPPHRTFLKVRCPTIPIFAWEFDTLPDEVWGGDERNDWRVVLSRFGAAVTHSHYSAQAIKRTMGGHFPVLAVPAPTFERTVHLYGKRAFNHSLTIPAEVIDSRSGWTVLDQQAREPAAAARKSFVRRLKITAFLLLLWYREVVRDLLPTRARRGISSLGQMVSRVRAEKRLTTASEQASKQLRAGGATPPEFFETLVLDGIVYTAIFNPDDGRKNWEEILLAFCSALAEREDATLVLKFAIADATRARDVVRNAFQKLRPFKCRVIALSGFLDDEQYGALISASTYAVNASFAEGQCLPLMEFMASGKPAIAPCNTALCDYIDEEVAFVLRSSEELCCWPHDPRLVYRTHRYRANWESLCAAFAQSYRVAKEAPERYDAMSRHSVERMRGFCSQEVVWEKFEEFVKISAATQSMKDQTLPGPSFDRFNALNSGGGGLVTSGAPRERL